ncbi:MAG TPA: ABC transporter, partial [Myxococcaceae bacterium]|nr:ABC transporter [Myxococcaceae bacterium]
YSSHPSVTTAGRLGGRAPLLMFGAGFLESAGDRPQGVRVDFTVRSHPSTWNDANGNFELDAPAEVRRTYELAAAIGRPRPDAAKGAPETRLMVLGDSDALGDPVIENPGNAYLALDGMKWLLGDDLIIGEISSEEDAPIQHTRKQDVFWFYSTVFLAPALVLGAGFFATRRRGGSARRRARREAGQSMEAAR